MEITREDLQRVHSKFVTDPDWHIVESLIEQFIEPLKTIETIDTKGKTADEVFAQVEGRKLSVDAMSSFLNEMRLLKTSVTKTAEDSSYK